MDKAIIIHTLNLLDNQFKPYLTILSHDSREKEHLPSLEVLAKALEDEEQQLSNQDQATANYAKKEKKPKPKTKKDSTSKDPDNANASTSGEQAPYQCTRCHKSHVKGECWMDKMTCNGCGKVGHIKKFCKKKDEKGEKKEESEATTFEASTKKLSCYLQRSISLHTVLNCSRVTTTSLPNSKVILDCGATDYFFSNRDFFTTYTEHYHEFQTGLGQILAAYGYGNVRLIMVYQNQKTNVINLSNVSWVPDLGHNLFSTIPLSCRGIEVQLKPHGVPTEILSNGKIQELADISDRQYVLRIQFPEAKSETCFANTIPIVNVIKPTLKLWHQRMGHLEYQNLLKLPTMSTGTELT
ncbi:hypothetical protein MMC07_009972 [Pseudocyphellaria aurata]|nr:hypothetical protein [Pseudocyphellaria aurata]